jgi:gluconokinase
LRSSLTAKSVFVGLDVGTTGVKAAGYTESGSLVAYSRRNLQLLSPISGAAEQIPDDYLRLSLSVLAECVQEISTIGNFHVEAVCLSSIVGSMVALDKHANPLMNALTWADLRCAPDVLTAQKELDEDAIYQMTGSQFHGIYTGPKIAWFKRTQPDLYSHASHFIPTKTFLLHRLTGHMVLDRSVGSGSGLLNIAGPAWNDEWITYLGLDTSSLGDIVEPECRFRFKRAIAESIGIDPNTPLFAGAADGMLSNIGVGSIAPGSYTAMIATSAACRTILPRPVLHPERKTWSYYLADGLWVNGVSISSAGVVLGWIRDHYFGQDDPEQGYAKLMDVAAKAPIGAGGLLMLPYLAGERSPHWNVNARGVFFGLTLGHQESHIARAAIEGITMHFADVVNALIEICGEPTEIRATGGFRKSELWTQLLSNILDRPLALPGDFDAATFGAAMLAMKTCGIYKSLAAATRLVTIERHVEPDPDSATRYARLLPFYRRLYGSLEERFTELPNLLKAIS